MAAALATACTPGASAPSKPASFAQITALPAHADGALLRLAERVTDPRRVDPSLSAIGWRTLDLSHPPDLGIGGVDSESARRINGLLPALGARTPSAAPFYLPAAGPERERAMTCLTQAIYYEAALEPDAGQAAVAQIVLNRVRHPAYPHSICGVVYQGVELGIGCQFTFVCDGALRRRPEDRLWRRAWMAAERAVNGYVMPAVGSATFYHADYVFPRWGPSMIKIGQIGAHIFYRFPGPIGMPGALSQAYRGGELRVDTTPRAPALTLVSTLPTATGSYFYVDPRAAQRQPGPSSHEMVFGRRMPTRDEIDRINAALAEMDQYSHKHAAAPAPAPAPEPASDDLGG